MQGVSPVCAALLSRHTASRPHQAQSGLCARQSPQARYSAHAGCAGHSAGGPCSVASSGAGEASTQASEARLKPQPAARHGVQAATEDQ